MMPIKLMVILIFVDVAVFTEKNELKNHKKMLVFVDIQAKTIHFWDKPRNQIY